MIKLFMVEVLFVLLFSIRAFAANSDWHSPYEIGYFTDADQLQEVETRIASVVTTRKKSRQAFCERTYEGVLKPWVDLADFNEAQEAHPYWYRSFFSSERENLRSNVLKNNIYGNNPPGFANTGMCWFWSRLERASMYLMRANPNKPKPTAAERRLIIQKLIMMDSVIEVPGYNTVHEFFEDDAKTERALLNEVDLWAVRTFFRMFVRVGDRGEEATPSEKRNRLLYLHNRIQNKKEMVFVRFNLDPEKAPLGIISHSYLIMDAKYWYEDVPSGGSSVPKLMGYQFIANDPNQLSSSTWLKCAIHPTNENSDYSSRKKCDQIARSYDDYDEDMDNIRNAIDNYCSS